MYIQKGIKFLLHKRKPGETHNLAIRMRVTLRGQRPLDFPTGHNIDLKDWDANNQCALKSAPGAADINRTIDEWKAIMNEVFARYELLEKRVPTLGEIKDLFNDMVGRKTKTNESLADPNMDLFHVFDLFTDMMGKQNQWTPSTFEKFAAIKHHLYDFDPHLSFPGINESKMQAYLAYLERKNCETPPSPRILLLYVGSCGGRTKRVLQWGCSRHIQAQIERHGRQFKGNNIFDPRRNKNLGKPCVLAHASRP